MSDQEQAGGDVSSQMQRILYEVKKIVVGQDHFLERVLVAILAQGHLLVEGVPGLAKTLTVKTLARTVRGTFRRIQFTPDLVPADLVGTRVYNQKTGEFTTSLGPVFNNLLLADEINRAPAKVQSALLEAMQEKQVTIGDNTFKLEEPFLVLAQRQAVLQAARWLPFSHIDFIKLEWTHQRGMVTLHDQMRESQRFVPPAHMDPDEFPGDTLRREQSVERNLQIHSGCGRKDAAGGNQAV